MVNNLKNIVLLCLFCYGAFAQNNVELPKIEIQENRLLTPFSESTRSLEVLTKNELRYYPVNSVAELLQFVSGVDVRRRGPNGVQSDLSLRGSTFEQVLVLINGVKIIDPQTGHHILNLPLDDEIIERIEIVKGAAGRIYGQGALAGAVNIVTKLPKKSQGALEFSIGQNGLFGGKIGGNITTKSTKKEGLLKKRETTFKSNTYASFAYDQADPGHRENNYFNRYTGFVQSDLTFLDQDISIMGAYVDNRFGANSFYAAGDDESYEEVKTGFVSIQSKHKMANTSIMPAISWRNNNDHYVFIKDNPSVYENNHTTNVYSVAVNANTILGNYGALGYGVEFRREDIESNNLGNHDRNVFTTNLEYKLYLFDEKLKLVPGVSYNYYSDFGETFLWGTDASFQLTKKFNVFANVGSTFRIPSYTELYYTDRSNEGNSALKPEEAFTYEAGLKYISKKYFVQASYFKRDGTNIIDWVMNGEPTSADSTILKWRPDNITNLPVQGVDISYTIDVGRISFISPLRKVRFGYTYIDGKSIQEGDLDSRYALEHIKNQYTVVSYFSFLNTLKFSMGYRYIDRINQDSYGIWDFTIGGKYKGFYLDMKINNSTNTEYEEYPGISMPKRWVRGSIKYTFK